jgi:hypothetical protein
MRRSRQVAAAPVEYGSRKIAIPKAQYRANGYRPPLDELPTEPMPLGNSGRLSVSQKSSNFGQKAGRQNS